MGLSGHKRKRPHDGGLSERRGLCLAAADTQSKDGDPTMSHDVAQPRNTVALGCEALVIVGDFEIAGPGVRAPPVVLGGHVVAANLEIHGHGLAVNRRGRRTGIKSRGLAGGSEFRHALGSGVGCLRRVHKSNVTDESFLTRLFLKKL